MGRTIFILKGHDFWKEELTPQGKLQLRTKTLLLKTYSIFEQLRCSIGNFLSFLEKKAGFIFFPSLVLLLFYKQFLEFFLIIATYLLMGLLYIVSNRLSNYYLNKALSIKVETLLKPREELLKKFKSPVAKKVTIIQKPEDRELIVIIEGPGFQDKTYVLTDIDQLQKTNLEVLVR